MDGQFWNSDRIEAREPTKPTIVNSASPQDMGFRKERRSISTMPTGSNKPPRALDATYLI